MIAVWKHGGGGQNKTCSRGSVSHQLYTFGKECKGSSGTNRSYKGPRKQRTHRSSASPCPSSIGTTFHFLACCDCGSSSKTCLAGDSVLGDVMAPRTEEEMESKRRPTKSTSSSKTSPNTMISHTRWFETLGQPFQQLCALQNQYLMRRTSGSSSMVPE